MSSAVAGEELIATADSQSTADRTTELWRLKSDIVVLRFRLRLHLAVERMRSAAHDLGIIHTIRFIASPLNCFVRYVSLASRSARRAAQQY